MNAIKKIREVANDTLSGYDRTHEGVFLYRIYKGRHQLYSHDATMPGVTIEFQNKYDNSTSIVYCDNINRAIEIVEYQEANRDEIWVHQQAIGDYIRTNKLY